MKQKSILSFLSLMTMVLFLVSCGLVGEATAQDFPDIGVPTTELNKYIKINAPSTISSFSKENEITLVVENLSQSSITLEPDTDVKIFMKSSSGWEPVSNQLNYNEAQWHIPVKGEDLPPLIPFGIFPVLYNQTKPIVLRVVVIGKPENIPNVTQVVSYADITVTP